VASLPDELKDRYRVHEELGRGGFGVVIAAEDLELGRRVAIKLLDHHQEPDFAARFQREAQVTASLRHPHVVAVYDYGVAADGIAYILYELVEGRSLAREVAVAPPPPEVVVRWGVQLAEALQAAHEAGVVHRDVKPGNALLRGDGQAVLCDFGIAYRALGLTVITEDGVRLGTPAYMAPEAIVEGAYTPAADQFALASTLLEALTGLPAYGTAELYGVLREAQAGGPLGGAALARVPEGLRKVLARALERDPAARYPDLGSLARALGRADLRGVPRGRALTRVGPGPTGQTTTRKRLRSLREPRSRRIIRRIGAGWTIVLLAAGVAYGLLSGGGSPGPTPAGPTPEASPRDVGESRAEQVAARDAAAAALAREVATWAATHRESGKASGSWLPLTDPVHLEAAREQAYDASFARRLRDLERAFLAWVDSAARLGGESYPEGIRTVARELLPHVYQDLRAIHDRAWSEAFGGNIRLNDGQHRVPKHQQEMEAACTRIVERLVRPDEDEPLWLLRDALWLGAATSIETSLLEPLLKRVLQRLGREDVEPVEFRASVLALTRAAKVLRNRRRWSCSTTRAFAARLANRLVELPRARTLRAAAIPIVYLLNLESSLLGSCYREEADQALLDLQPLLVDLEAHVDHRPGEPSDLLGIASEVRTLWRRSTQTARTGKYQRSKPVVRMLRNTFWFAEKLAFLRNLPEHQVVPEPLDDRAAWIRARIPDPGASPEALEEAVADGFRGLRLMAPYPWGLLQASGEMAVACPFPGRTYLGGRLRLQLLATESEEERAPMRTALDALTSNYAPREDWGCRMLRGEMWGSVHAEQALRQHIAPELDFFTATETLSPFLSGAGASAALVLRDCRDEVTETDLNQAKSLLEDGVRGRDRGVRTASEAICRLAHFPGPKWEALAQEDHPVYLLMQRLCQ
jgi:serine/threonine-protein kinase